MKKLLIAMIKLARNFKLSIVFACILAGHFVFPAASVLAAELEKQIPLAERVEAKQFYDDAKAKRNAGDASSAQQLLESALALNPNLAVAHSLLAEMLAATGQFATASVHMESAIALSPTDPDIKMAQARILSWQGKNTEAKTIMADVVAAFPEYVDAQDFFARLQIAATKVVIDKPTWQAGVLFSRSTFSKIPLTPWKQTTFILFHQINDRNSAIFTFDAAERFSLHDVSLALRINHNFKNNSGVYFSLLHTVGAEFLPKWTVSAGGFLKLADGDGFLGPTIVGIDGKYNTYGLVKVKGLDLWLSQYIFDGKAWLTLRSINSFVNDGKNPKGFSLRGDGYLKDNIRFYAGYANAPESDRGIVTSTKSYFTGLNFSIRSNLDFNVNYAHHDREGSYIRKEIVAGLTYKF